MPAPLVPVGVYGRDGCRQENRYHSVGARLAGVTDLVMSGGFIAAGKPIFSLLTLEMELVHFGVYQGSTDHDRAVAAGQLWSTSLHSRQSSVQSSHAS